MNNYNEKKIIALIKNILRPIYHFFLDIYNRHMHQKEIKLLLKVSGKEKLPIIYYLGITTHNNLGDNAQFYCISNWIKNNYPNSKVCEFTAPAIVDKQSGFIESFIKIYRKIDFIIFQSGYTTQDLGGQHEEMHRLIIDNIPFANILMMPQTVFFKKKINKNRCSRCYNKAFNMLFLARDSISFQKAKVMLPNITVKLFPDIVTTLIGEYDFQNKREGVLICRRNDGEKYYKEEELMLLKNDIENKLNEKVTISDTTTDISTKKLHQNIEGNLIQVFEEYSKYKVVITDRYHGTIFSLIANTPVVVIKTNDHKVITGVDWFKGVYDNTVVYAETLESAFDKVNSIFKNKESYKLKPYFNEKYYNKLKFMFEENLGD